MNTIQTRPQQTQSAPPPEFIAAGKTFKSFEDLIAAWQKNNPQDRLEEKNPYTDPETGEVNFFTLRIIPQRTGKKEFRQVSKNEQGLWHWKQPAGKLPIFNRKRIAECETIVICEGEKCVRKFTELGFEGIAATTAPGGALNALKADWSYLAGKKCIVWQDNDEPGKKYEQDVISELMKLQPPCMVARARVEELGLNPKDDLVDYLETVAGTLAERRAAVALVLQDAEQLNSINALRDKFERIHAGLYRSIPFPQMPFLSSLSKALIPGTLTTICGDPGAGKSFFLTETFWRLNVECGTKVKLLMLEDSADFHQNRALAQMSGHADLTDDEFIRENREFSDSVLEQYSGRLEYFARNLEVADSRQMTLDEIVLWVKHHAENGVEVIGVDPITAAKVSEKPHVDDQRFLFGVKEVLERTGARLILATHPRMGQAGKPSLSGMAGGASYPRFSQTVLWLKNFEKNQESDVWKNPARLRVWHRQQMEIRKARNGKGQGKAIAMQLNYQNLCCDELGVIEEQKTKGL